MAESSTGGMASPIQPSLKVTKAGSLMEQVDGCQPIHTNLMEHDQNETGTLLMDLGQPNSGLGPNTRTWKRLQVQTKVVGTVCPSDVEVGSKRKHKANLNFSEYSETPELKKRKGDDEVLVVSNLLKNEFGSAVDARQHHRKQ